MRSWTRWALSLRLPEFPGSGERVETPCTIPGPCLLAVWKLDGSGPRIYQGEPVDAGEAGSVLRVESICTTGGTLRAPFSDLRKCFPFPEALARRLGFDPQTMLFPPLAASTLFVRPAKGFPPLAAEEEVRWEDVDLGPEGPIDDD